jgi:hypothetical protein
MEKNDFIYTPPKYKQKSPSYWKKVNKNFRRWKKETGWEYPKSIVIINEENLKIINEKENKNEMV